MIKKLLSHLWPFLFSILAWSVAIGLFLLIRWVGSQSLADWTPDTETLLLIWVASSVLLGITFRFVLLLAETRLFRARPYGLLILAKSMAMLVAAILVLVIRGAIAVAVGDMTTAAAWSEGVGLVTHPELAVLLLYVLLTTTAFGFVFQMSAMTGRRVLVNLLLGKYYHPKTETRIFMFLDLKGSTAIAERLGHEEFFRLIQECFRDLTDSAIRRNVEIYQYVGDEAILTWRPEQGLEDCNCLRVFFDFKQVYESRSEYYLEQFGVVPQFKAGANLGPVTVAEIGIIKRDIAYLSDVLNTAARLESMCREHDAELLITESLKEALPHQVDLDCQPIGELEVRGKSERIGVFRVETCS
ncbi:MAG: adenylate/guanylate cyclase domain-containing protein [Bythopirellula sp.]